MRQPEARPAAVRHEFDRHHSLSPFCCGGPRQFYQPIAIQPEEVPVVRMPLAFEVSLEEEGGVNFALHQH